MSAPDVQTAVGAHLVLIARLAGGPVDPTDATAQWAARRLDWHGPNALTFTCDDGATTVHVTGDGAKDCLVTLLEALLTPERKAAAQARVEAVTRVDAGRVIDPEEPRS